MNTFFIKTTSSTSFQGCGIINTDKKAGGSENTSSQTNYRRRRGEEIGNMAKNTENTYDGSQIQVLEGLEPVRKRPGMYIGSTGYDGVHHLIKEIADNSIDEAIAGFASKVEVVIQADGGMKISDDGRGIPVDKHPKTGLSTLETVLTVLHAGGKFGGGGYKVSSGLHGVGSSVVNALSDRKSVV